MSDDLKKQKKLRKEMSNFQKGYNEALHTQFTYPKPISDIGNVVNRAVMSTEREKMGQDVGIQDAKAALKYQAEQSLLETKRQKEENKKRVKALKGK